MGTVRQLTGKSARQDANRANEAGMALEQQQLDLSKQQFEWQKGIATEQRDFDRGLLAEDRSLASEDFTRRLGIVDELRESANFSPEFYDQQVGMASAQARDSLGRQRDMAARNMGRMGVNPNSGRAASMEAQYALSGAAGEAASANQMRMGLGQEERARMDSARTAGLTVAPQFVGRNANNPLVGMQDPSIGVIGQMANRQFSHAQQMNQQAASSRAGLMSAVGMIGGAAIGGPIGGAIGAQMFGNNSQPPGSQQQANYYTPGQGLPPYAHSWAPY